MLIPLINPGNKKKDRLHHRKLFGYPEKSNFLLQRNESDPVCTHKIIPDFENEGEGQSEVDGCNFGIEVELDSFNIQESSCVSSVSDEVSIDTSSFRLLQQVMEQLDITTRLCISIGCPGVLSSDIRVSTSLDGEYKDGGGTLLSDGTNKRTGFMDMETETNPIDRSIAHLFHRPLNPSTTVGFNAVSLKSRTMVQALNHGLLVAKKPVYEQETTLANEAAEG